MAPFITTVPGATLLIILGILSAASFVPQLSRIWSTRDSSGISLVYVLCNVISATHQLNVAVLFFAFTDEDNLWVWTYPQGLTDWVNIAQLVIVWVGMLLLFIACLVTSPSSPRVKALVASFYLLVLILTFGILIRLLSDPTEYLTNPDAKDWAAHWWIRYCNLRWAVIPVTMLNALALYPQYQAIVGREPGDGLGGLSLKGLLVQAIVFAVVALAWVFRAPWESQEPAMTEGMYFGWYRSVGWAAVDNGIFAVVQAVLFLVASRDTAGFGALGEETVLLLRSDEL